MTLRLAIAPTKRGDVTEVVIIHDTKTNYLYGFGNSCGDPLVIAKKVIADNSSETLAESYFEYPEPEASEVLADLEYIEE